YAYAMRHMSRAQAVESETDFLGGRGAGADTIRRLTSITAVVPPLGHWAAGLKGVSLLDVNGRGANYLRGEVRTSRFWSYFFMAFLVKPPPAVLVLVAVGAILARRDTLLAPWPLGLLAAAVVFFAAAVRSSFNIGVRHILPVYPLLVLVAAGV